MLLIDGMGAELVAARSDVAPFLAGLPDRSMTAGFPSTTATSLASLGTGYRRASTASSATCSRSPTTSG